MTALAQQFPMPVAGLQPVDMATANALLVEWGHYLGPCNRPFGQEGWTFDVDGRPVAVAVSASIVSSTITDAEGRCYQRGQVVELARLCSGEGWATRVMLRLWREIAAPRWRHWPASVALAYSQNDRHEGRIYRFDGWTKVRTNCGSSGGGAWTRKRYATDAALGQKTLWLYELEASA